MIFQGICRNMKCSRPESPRSGRGNATGSGDAGASRRLSNPLQRRLLPLALERFLLWPIESHDNEEWPLGRGQPVGLLIGAGGFVLKVECTPAIGILLEPREHL